MIVGFAFGLAALAVLATHKRRAAAPPEPAPLIGPVDADREGWVQMQDAPGLAIRAPSRSWTSPAVRQLLLAAGQVALQLGGELQVGDIGPAERGTPFDPHLSHRWGRDIDIALTLDAYPTPDDVPVDLRVVAVLDAVSPYIETVGINEIRAAPFEGRAFKVSHWDGHKHHLHLRLRSDLVAQPKAVAFGPASAELGGDDEVA